MTANEGPWVCPECGIAPSLGTKAEAYRRGGTSRTLFQYRCVGCQLEGYWMHSTGSAAMEWNRMLVKFTAQAEIKRRAEQDV